MQQHGSKYFARRNTLGTMMWGQKIKTFFLYVKVVMLHKKKVMEHIFPCKHI